VLSSDPYLQATADNLNLGILLLDADCRIRFANAAAGALLRRGGGLEIRHGRLRATTASVNKILKYEINRISSERSSRAHRFKLQPGSSAASGPSIVLAHSGRRRTPSDANGSVIIVLIRDPGVTAGFEQPLLRTLYNLTGAEAQLLQALLEGRRLTEYAASNTITLNTARSYLKRLFRKTGTTRQSDLVRLVLLDQILQLVSSPADTFRAPNEIA
jgi:DNA-binding CsgD family transcriptional regulator